MDQINDEETAAQPGEGATGPQDAQPEVQIDSAKLEQLIDQHLSLIHI